MTNPADPAAAHLEDESLTVPIQNSALAFEGAVWKVRRDQFAYGEGTLVREFVDHTGAVAVLAFDDEDRVLLIKQYRHPVRVKDWEIPAGLLDAVGEQPLAAAQRELAEETDLVAREWSLLSEFYTSPGGSNEAIRIYLARGLSAAPETFSRTGEEADIELRWVPLEEAVSAVLARRVQNPILAMGVLTALVSRGTGWSSLGDADAPWPRHPKLAAQQSAAQQSPAEE